jgi:hypothetical protein
MCLSESPTTMFAADDSVGHRQLPSTVGCIAGSRCGLSASVKKRESCSLACWLFITRGFGRELLLIAVSGPELGGTKWKRSSIAEQNRRGPSFAVNCQTKLCTSLIRHRFSWLIVERKVSLTAGVWVAVVMNQGTLLLTSSPCHFLSRVQRVSWLPCRLELRGRFWCSASSGRKSGCVTGAASAWNPSLSHSISRS